MKYVNKLIKKMNWYDLQFIKLSVFFFTLMLVVAWPGFLAFVLSYPWYVYLILMIIFALFVFKKVLS